MPRRSPPRGEVGRFVVGALLDEPALRARRGCYASRGGFDVWMSSPFSTREGVFFRGEPAHMSPQLLLVVAPPSLRAAPLRFLAPESKSNPSIYWPGRGLVSPRKPAPPDGQPCVNEDTGFFFSGRPVQSVGPGTAGSSSPAPASEKTAGRAQNTGLFCNSSSRWSPRNNPFAKICQ